MRKTASSAFLRAESVLDEMCPEHDEHESLITQYATKIHQIDKALKLQIDKHRTSAQSTKRKLDYELERLKI